MQKLFSKTISSSGTVKTILLRLKIKKGTQNHLEQWAGGHNMSIQLIYHLNLLPNAVTPSVFPPWRTVSYKNI